MTAASVASNEKPHDGTAWGIILLQGIFSVLIGVLFLLAPGMSTLVLVQVLGFYWLIVGVIDLVSMFINRRAWFLKLIAGLIGILAGLAIIQYPLWSAILIPTTIVIILGIQGIIFGIASIAMAFTGGGWGPGIIGLLSLILGVLLVSSPMSFAPTLITIFGIVSLIGGVSAIIYAFSSKKSK